MADAQTPFDLVEPEREVLASFSRRTCSALPAEENGEQARRLNEATRITPPTGGGGWTIPMICIGVALIACCMLIPAAEENRRLAYERQRLRADLDQITKQIEINDEFLKRVADDPSLSERLAQRQMKMVREGSSVLSLRGESTGLDITLIDL